MVEITPTSVSFICDNERIHHIHRTSVVLQVSFVWSDGFHVLLLLIIDLLKVCCIRAYSTYVIVSVSANSSLWRFDVIPYQNLGLSLVLFSLLKSFV